MRPSKGGRAENGKLLSRLEWPYRRNAAYTKVELGVCLLIPSPVVNESFRFKGQMLLLFSVTGVRALSQGPLPVSASFSCQL